MKLLDSQAWCWGSGRDDSTRRYEPSHSFACEVASERMSVWAAPSTQSDPSASAPNAIRIVHEPGMNQGRREEGEESGRVWYRASMRPVFPARIPMYLPTVARLARAAVRDILSAFGSGIPLTISQISPRTEPVDATANTGTKSVLIYLPTSFLLLSRHSEREVFIHRVVRRGFFFCLCWTPEGSFGSSKGLVLHRPWACGRDRVILSRHM